MAALSYLSLRASLTGEVQFSLWQVGCRTQFPHWPKSRNTALFLWRVLVPFVTQAGHNMRFKEPYSYVVVPGAQLFILFLRWTFGSLFPLRVKSHQPLSSSCQYQQGKHSARSLPGSSLCPKQGACIPTTLNHVTKPVSYSGRTALGHLLSKVFPAHFFLRWTPQLLGQVQENSPILFYHQCYCKWESFT